MKGVGGREDMALPENNSQTRERELKWSDGRIRDYDKESDDLGLYLPAVNTIGEFKARLDKFAIIICWRGKKIQVTDGIIPN